MAETQDIATLITRLDVRMDKFERAFDRAERKAGTTTRGIDRQFSRLNRRVERYGQQMGRGFTRAFAPLIALAAPAALGAVVQRSLAAAEAIQDMSSRANVAAEFLQELRYAASQNGAEARDFDDAISRLNRRLGLLLTTGTSPAKAAFDELGLTTRIASGELRDAESVFNAAVGAMQRIETQAERSALASQLFGEDSGPRLLQLMSLGTRGIEEQRQAARDLGVVMSNALVDEAARAADTLERMHLQFTTGVNSAIASQADELVALAEALGRVAEWAVNAGAAMGDFFSRFSVEGQGLALPSTEEGLQARLAQINRLRSELDLGGRLEAGDFTGTTLNSPFAQPGQVGLARIEEARAREIGQLVGSSRRQELIAAAEETGESLASVFARELAGMAASVETRLNDLPSSTDTGNDTGNGNSGTASFDRDAANTAAEEAADRARAREQAYNEQWLRQYRQREALELRELEHQRTLAELRGDDDTLRRLEREIELRERTVALMEMGVAYGEAGTMAGQELDAEELARNQGEFRDFFRDAFKDGLLATFDGNAGEALSNWWREYVSRAMSGVLDQLADLAFNFLSENAGGIGQGIASVFGGFRANGGPTYPNRYYEVGEKGRERFIPSMAGSVVPMASPALPARSGMVAGSVVRLQIEEGPLFNSRVSSIAGPISVNHATTAFTATQQNQQKLAESQQFRLRR